MKQFSLDDMQVWFKHNLMFPNQTKDSIEDVVHTSKRQNSSQKFAVYQRSYFLRLLKCMQEQYPALCFALGKDLFNDFVRSYLEKHPSNSYTLYALGTLFPEFLSETRPDKDMPLAKRENWIDFMLDLAHFELSLYLMFDAKGHEFKNYATIESQDNQLQLQSCFQIGCYNFDVAAYYHQVKQKQSPCFPAYQKSYIALVRNNFRTQTIAIKATHYTLLNALKSKHSVADSLVIVSQKHQLNLAEVIDIWSQPEGLRNKWITLGFFGVKN